MNSEKWTTNSDGIFFCPPLYKGGGTLQGGGFVDYSYLEVGT